MNAAQEGERVCSTKMVEVFVLGGIRRNIVRPGAPSLEPRAMSHTQQPALISTRPWR